MVYKISGVAVVVWLLLTVGAFAAGVQTGQVEAVDRERHLVQLDDGSVYYVPNRASLSDFRPGRRATIWYRDRDGVREVFRHEIKGRRRF
ncbi:MAG: DUF1344 domain-containing protein [Pseudomonadota bacterium]